MLEMYPSPSEQYPSVYNATSAIWRDAHMLCLAHDLGKWRTEALGQPVWRYRFDLVADNLNSQGAAIGTFHGELYTIRSALVVLKTRCRRRHPFCHGVSITSAKS